MTTKAAIFTMSALELVEESEEQINVFQRPLRNTSVALVEMVKSQAVRIAELEKQLKPDLFWSDNEPELGFDSAHEAIESMFDDINAQVGSVFTLDRAVKLPSQDYVLTEFDEIENSFEYEALKEQRNDN